MIYYGDFAASKIIYMTLNTFDSTGASVTVTDLVAGDVKIHKAGGTTQRSSSAGITVTIDYDSITGNHLIAIDTSDNTDAGFYAAGNDYQVRVEGITVATKTLNIWVGSFSIENRSALRPTTAGRTLDVSTTGEVGLDFDNIKAATGATTLTNITVPTVTTTGTATNVTNAVTITSNSDITAIKTTTDKFAFTTANQVDARVLTNSDKTGYTVSTVSDKTGYSISGTKTTLDALNDFNPTTTSVDIGKVKGTALTETSAGRLAGNFSFFYDVPLTTTKTVNDVGVAGSGLTAQQVWEYATRTLTSGGSGGATAQEVWEYATRTLSAGTNLNNLSAQQVWEYVNRTLTANTNLLSALDVWTYATRVLTAGTNLNNLSASDVWNYVTRVLTAGTNLNNISTAQVNSEVASALATYDPPTNTEMEARTLINSGYATATTQGTHTTLLNDIPTNTEFNARTILSANYSTLTVQNIIDGITDGTLDLQEIIRLLVSILANNSTGGGTNTLTFKDSTGTKNRQIETVDSNGNRTVVSRDLT